MKTILKTLDQIAEKTLRLLLNKNSEELEGFISAREIRELCIYSMIFGSVCASVTIVIIWGTSMLIL